MDVQKMTMLKLCVLALFVAYAYAGRDDGFCVCEAYGNYHYKTFDDALISFEGSCGYILSETKPDAERQFTIKIWKRKYGNEYQRTLYIVLGSSELSIYKGSVLYRDGKKCSIPYNGRGGINVSMEGNILKVYLAWMLTILVNGKQQVTIKVPESYRNNMTGICGDCNKDASDDYREKGTKNNLMKSSASASKIAESYRYTNGNSDKVCPVDLVTSKCDNSKKCFPMWDDAFKDCQNVIGSKTVFSLMESCKVDVCMGNEQDKCPAFERFATKCKQENIPIKWKAMVGCEDPCDDKPCKNNATCTRRATKYTCRCKYGFLGDNCETVDKCISNPCGDNGECETVDDTFKCNCNKGFIGDRCERVDPCEPNPCKNYGVCNVTKTEYICLCKKNFKGMNCENAIPDCVCRVFGDPHYITFDGQLIHFMGKCKYTLAASKASSKLPKFSVEVKNHHRGNTRVSYTRIVDVKFNGNTFRMLPGSKLKVNEILMILPLTNYLEVNATFVLGWVTVMTNFGLKVEFDGAHRVIVSVSSMYMDELTGICGDCNQEKDDYKTKSGGDVTSVENKFSLIGASYQVDDDSDIPETNCTVVDYVAKCSSSDTIECDSLKLPTGPFKKCLANPKISSKLYLEACRSDVCAYKSFPKIVKQVLCQAYEAFALECQKVEVFTYWRKAVGCKRKCNSNQYYMFMSPLCQINCLTLPTICNNGFGEGCVCKRGNKVMGDVCVKSSSCGCEYQGVGMQSDTNMLTADCLKTAYCSRRNRMSESQGCQKNEECLRQSGKRVCQCPPSFKKDNLKCLAPTFPEDTMAAALTKFFRVSMAYIEGKSLQTISTNRPGLCAVICRNKTNCKSFNFDEMKDECNLFSVNAVNNTLVTINCPFQDYYQLIESKDIVIRGGSIFPCGPLTEFAVVKTLEDCKAKCTKNKCKSMEYSLVNQECSISNSTGKNFELNGDDEFVYYGNFE